MVCETVADWLACGRRTFGACCASAAAASTKTASREAAARDESLGKGFIWNFSSSDFAGGSFWATENFRRPARSRARPPHHILSVSANGIKQGGGKFLRCCKKL